MISKIVIRGNLRSRIYLETKSENCLYFYPSKGGNTIIEYDKKIEITSFNLNLTLDINNCQLFNNFKCVIDTTQWVSNDKYKFAECLTFQFVYSNEIDIIDKFDMVKKNRKIYLKNILAIAILKWICFELYCLVFLKIPMASLDYIKKQPIGIKQNTIIKEFLGFVCCKFISVQKQVLLLFYLPLSLFYLEKLFFKLNIAFIFLLYKTVLDRMVDIAELFNNKTYNNLKKRYDHVKLSIDQIIMCVLFFSISVLTMINLLCYYLLYVLFFLIFQAFELIDAFILLLLIKTDNVFYFERQSGTFHRVYFYQKILIVYDYLSQDINFKGFKKILRGDVHVKLL